MSNSNLLCSYCRCSLADQGVVIESEIGSLLMCTVCRGLFYINFIVNPNNEISSIAIKSVNLPQEAEFDIIRYSIGSIPLSQYLLEQKAQVAPPDIKEVIESSITPSDLLRKLQE